MKRLLCVSLIIFGVVHANAIEPLVTDWNRLDKGELLDLRYTWIFDIDNNRIIKQTILLDIQDELTFTRCCRLVSDEKYTIYVFYCDYEQVPVNLFVAIPTNAEDRIMITLQMLIDNKADPELLDVYLTEPTKFNTRDNISNAAYSAFVEQFAKDIGEAVQSKQSVKSKSKSKR